MPGTMIAALATGLGSLDVPIPATAGMVGTSWRFLHPVRPGDSLHTVWRLNRKRPVTNPRVGLCFWQIDVLNQHGTVVATGEVGRLVHRRHPAEAGHDGARAAEAEEPAARTRRRRGRRSSSTERAAEVVESAPVPEPAPADAPAPSRRRRRRRGNGHGHGNGQASATERSEPEPAPAPASTSAERPATGEGRGLRGVLRRLRGS